MLINISEHLSVQRYRNQDHTQWICYEPLANTQHQKRRPWSRITGLMSGAEMQLWLGLHYPDSGYASSFSEISGN
ncbi:hypothetical protein [Amphritea sp. HPY]|uniref:hypothetical protein n=1 Tax=Amphritea sp. HPY TaxID=3421652 RepID=UPI003D7F05BD